MSCGMSLIIQVSDVQLGASACARAPVARSFIEKGLGLVATAVCLTSGVGLGGIGWVGTFHGERKLEVCLGGTRGAHTVSAAIYRCSSFALLPSRPLSVYEIRQVGTPHRRLVNFQLQM